MLITPDHPTPLSVMTHVGDPVPYIIYDSGKQVRSGANAYDESEAAKTGVFIDGGVNLMKRFLQK